MKVLQKEAVAALQKQPSKLVELLEGERLSKAQRDNLLALFNGASAVGQRVTG